MSDREGNYTYDPVSKRFRASDGRYIAASEVMLLRDTIIAAKVGRTSVLVDSLYAGTLSPAGFVMSMRTDIKRTVLMEYMLGKGGVNAMTQADYTRVGTMTRVQYGYLNTFTRQIIDGGVSQDRARQRAAMYIDTSRAAYGRGQAQAWNVDLPDYPGLHPNCACYWELVQDGNDVRAYWNTASARPCPECEDRESRWNPLVITGENNDTEL